MAVVGSLLGGTKELEVGLVPLGTEQDGQAADRGSGLDEGLPDVERISRELGAVAVAEAPPVWQGVVWRGFQQADARRQAGQVQEFLTERVLVIAQIESAKGLANVEEIAAVPGVDVLWVGHFDLTLSMGIPGQFESKQFLDAMDRVSAAAKARGLIGGFNLDSIESGRSWIERGYRMLAYQADFRLMAGALQAGVDGLRR